MHIQEFNYGQKAEIISSDRLSSIRSLPDQYIFKTTNMLNLDVAGATIRSINRSDHKNEDVFAAVQVSSTELLLVVADGMGGHANGREAAMRTVEMFPEKYKQLRSTEDELDIATSLGLTLAAINEAIITDSKTEVYPDGDGRGATVAFALLKTTENGFTAHTGHLGDARVYIGDESTIQQAGADHSTVQRAIDNGIITEKQRYTDPRRNRVSSYLGQATLPTVEFENDHMVEEDTFDYHIIEGLTDGAFTLLCSDGLWEMMPGVQDQFDPDGKKLHGIITVNQDTDIIVTDLINLALNGNGSTPEGGVDNITVLVAKINEKLDASFIKLIDKK